MTGGLPGAERATAPRPPARSSFCEFAGPLAMAHRGFSREGLENSLVAFGAAVDLGYTYLETDVRTSSDGELLAFHDERLDRVTDAAGVLSSLPWSRVRSALIGGREPIPRLEDLLGSFPHSRFNIDVKTDAALVGLGDVLRRTGCEGRVLVTAFGERRRLAALAEVGRAGLRDVATSASSVRTGPALLGSRLGRVPAVGSALVRSALGSVDAVQVPVRHRVAGVGVRVVTAELVDAAHRAGAQVHVWTVDDPVQMTALLDLGVDGLITDRADVLREVLRARGEWV